MVIVWGIRLNRKAYWYYWYLKFFILQQVRK